MYLNKVGNPIVKYSAFAIANPVVGDWVQMTNHHWTFSIETTRQALNLEVLILINDFTAQAYAISQMSSTELIQVGGTSCEINAPKAVLGPGTGLGVSGLIPCSNGGFIYFLGEGGRARFLPFDDIVVVILRQDKKKKVGVL